MRLKFLSLSLVTVFLLLLLGAPIWAQRNVDFDRSDPEELVEYFSPKQTFDEAHPHYEGNIDSDLDFSRRDLKDFEVSKYDQKGGLFRKGTYIPSDERRNFLKQVYIFSTQMRDAAKRCDKSAYENAKQALDNLIIQAADKSKTVTSGDYLPLERKQDIQGAQYEERQAQIAWEVSQPCKKAATLPWQYTPPPSYVMDTATGIFYKKKLEKDQLLAAKAILDCDAEEFSIRIRSLLRFLYALKVKYGAVKDENDEFNYNTVHDRSMAEFIHELDSRIQRISLQWLNRLQACKEPSKSESTQTQQPQQQEEQESGSGNTKSVKLSSEATFTDEEKTKWKEVLPQFDQAKGETYEAKLTTIGIITDDDRKKFDTLYAEYLINGKKLPRYLLTPVPTFWDAQRGMFINKNGVGLSVLDTPLRNESEPIENWLTGDGTGPVEAPPLSKESAPKFQPPKAQEGGGISNVNGPNIKLKDTQIKPNAKPQDEDPSNLIDKYDKGYIEKHDPRHPDQAKPKPSPASQAKKSINKMDMEQAAKKKLEKYVLEEEQVKKPATTAPSKPQQQQNLKTEEDEIDPIDLPDPQDKGSNYTPLAPEDPVKQAIRKTCEMTVQLYRDSLRSMVDMGWRSPKPPYKGRWTAVLVYNIDKQGRVFNIVVAQSSGYAPIDQSAVQRVYSLQGQFRPLPSCYEKESMEVEHTFTVIYR